MKRTILIASFFAVIFCSCTQEIVKGDLLIENINIIDVESGEIEQSIDVVITDDTISNISKSDEKIKYSVKSSIDGTGKYLIPGLWDMHAHTWDYHEHYAPILLANGIIGVREMDGNLKIINKLKQGLREKKYDGPLIVSSGRIIDGYPPNQEQFDVANTPEEGRAIVRKQKEEGADFIKVYFGLKEEVYLAIADECKKLGLTMAGHLPNKVPLDVSVKANHQTYDHFFNIMARAADQEGLAEIEAKKRGNHTGANFTKRIGYVTDTYDPKKADILYEILTSNGERYICPTFTVFEGWIRLRDSTYSGDYRKNYLPWIEPEVRSDFFTEKELQHKKKLEDWYGEALKLIKPLSDRGVKFLAGTDYPMWFCYPGFSVHEELEIMVKKAGLSTLEALQTATINPAEFLKLSDQYGTVKKGYKASLLILNANPLENIKNTQSINGLILAGKYFDDQELNEMLGSKKRK